MYQSTNKLPLFILLIIVSLMMYNCDGRKPIKSDTAQFASFDRTNISFSDQGNGEPIILIHGFINDKSSWDRSILKHELLKSGYRIIIPDLRGNGDSDHPIDPEAYKNNAEIKDIMALADHLGLDNYISIGYSRGSIVLAKLLVFDKRITKAVIGGMGVDFTNADWPRRIAFADAFSGRAELTDMTRGAVEYAQSINRNLKILGLQQDYQPVTTPDELSSIKIPTLVICGNSDTDNGDPKKLKEALPNAQLSIVEGDHNNTYKQENFASEVTVFVNQ